MAVLTVIANSVGDRALRGRAFETVTGIAVANYPGPLCESHSFAVDATGRIIAMTVAKPELLLATFDLAATRRTRR